MKIPGITREEEEKKLKRTIEVAKAKVEMNKQNIQALAEELHAMQEEFDESDKEAQTLWHDADARFKFVNQDLKRAEQARKKPYFGRIDFKDKKIGKPECYYIGRSVIADNPAEPEVIDWRAPIASVYYDSAIGNTSYAVKGEGKYEIELSRKRTYEIEDDKLKDFFDSDVVANDELLTKYLAKNKRAVLGEIIATIQKEQNEVIRKKPHHNLIIQGAAGSGKTTVAMHRISYILYNYELEFAPEDFYIVGSNQVLLNYITGVLPQLNVYGVSQMTMEQLFIRLLYEDWDKNKYSIKAVRKGVTPPIKGTKKWFDALEAFCGEYERKLIPRQDVVIEKNGTILLSAADIERIWERSEGLSRADKISRLTEHLTAKLENEISGKYYSYTALEKQKMTRMYENYFGRREWKGSIFELYDNFLLEMQKKGSAVELPGTEFDVYDLAALAYIYKRIKEDEIIREAGHVVIDEAQDFGMMAYCSLKYCLSKCTYTIMGDVSQNIFQDYGLNDWAELRTLMLPGEYDYFGLLRKSYRNTVEISNFATDILCHGTFQIYPVEPIIRHGNAVSVRKRNTFEELMEETIATVNQWQKDGMETIAVICSDDEESKRVAENLSGKVPLLSTGTEKLEFTEGVMVLPLEYTKGLEFDAVLLFDASAENYPSDDGDTKRLYVAATRALHELVVLYQGELTKLIADPVSEEKKKKVVVTTGGSRKKPKIVLEEKTNEEIYRQRSVEGEAERRRRELYGPRKVETARNTTVGIVGAMIQSVTDVEKTGRRQQAARQSNDETTPGQTAQAARTGTITNRIPSQTGSPVSKSLYGVQDASVARDLTESVSGEFGEMPNNASLQPDGHGKIDCSIRFSMKGKGYLDVVSAYGTLRIQPVAENTIRILFTKGQCDRFPEACKEMVGKGGKFRISENITGVEVGTPKLTVRVDKKTGALCFLNSKGKVMLSERPKDPRQIGGNKVWQFFEWGKEEALIAKGLHQKNLKLERSARYISYAREIKELPALASSRGYQIFFAPGSKLFCCNIPMYGSYIAWEDTAIIDYYFQVD